MIYQQHAMRIWTRLGLHLSVQIKKSYLLFCVVLLATVCVLLLVVIAAKYYIKPGLTIPCLLLY